MNNDLTDKVPNWPPNRLIIENGFGLQCHEECKICGSSLKRIKWYSNKKKCIQPLCQSNTTHKLDKIYKYF